mgnify:CR=1 FL=1|jgi:hypothetical protein|tara:strand:+ start:24028 stop:24225 length:198 start_codon:yes stop_codon:yes gene_type:complete
MTNKESSPTFFVVTRNKRRIEDKNYKNLSDAELRADKLRAVLKEWDPSQVNKVSITKTKSPNRVR